MSNTLITTLLAFMITLVLVVIVHELGHFLFCKMFGVYVKTFSIGIGPKVIRKRWGETEYVLSAIPFGGYVKMAGEGMMEEIQDTGTWEERKYPLGTEEGNAEAADMDEGIPLDRQFHAKPAWQRLLVFVAGPLFNVILAFVLYAGLIMVDGLQTIPFTRVGVVRAGAPAAEAGFRVGDVITAVNGTEVHEWERFQDLLLPAALEGSHTAPAARIRIERDGVFHDLELTPVYVDSVDSWSVGLEPWNTTVGLVQKGGPAAKLGLKRGDVLQSVAGQEVTSFSRIATLIHDHAGEPTTLVWKRNGRTMSGAVTPQLKEVAPGESVGRIFIEPYYGIRRTSLGKALTLGWQRTVTTIQVTVETLGDFVRRKLGLDSVGGPLRIGQAAGEMLRWSFGHLMYFVAFFSINLFLLNLLPIPVLDGGHVLFLLVEVICGGKPVPERLQAIATQIGLIILLLFMTFVVVLDVWKVTGH